MKISTKSVRGFTLIELMIVVAIIGILASLALPDFMKMIAKTKQSEAQANLAAIYTGQMVYWGTNGVFAGKADLQGKDAFAQIGFKTESEAVIKYTYIMDEAVLPGKVDLPYLPTAFESSATSFTAIAVSNVDTDATLDIWTVDNDRTFRNALNDVKF